MKIFTSSTLLMALLASLTTADQGDRAYNATASDDGATNKTTHRIKTAANVKGSGAQIQLCPSGDCVNGQAITLSMSRLEEIGTDLSVAQKAPNFNSLNGSWTAFELMTVNGTQAYASSFVANFKVGSATTDTVFNLTTMIYQANGTAMNGNQSIDVPAGALKFSVTITNWPFKATTNNLQFGVNLKAQGKKGGDPGAPKKGAKTGKTHMDRVDMGESMFMDAPTMAVADSLTLPINSTISTQGKTTELVWVFPNFKTSLYYDPTLGSEDPSASVTSDTNSTSNTTSTTTPTTTPAASTTAPKSSASYIASMAVATALAVVGAWLV